MACSTMALLQAMVCLHKAQMKAQEQLQTSKITLQLEKKVSNRSIRLTAWNFTSLLWSTTNKNVCKSV